MSTGVVSRVGVVKFTKNIPATFHRWPFFCPKEIDMYIAILKTLKAVLQAMLLVALLALLLPSLFVCMLLAIPIEIIKSRIDLAEYKALQDVKIE